MIRLRPFIRSWRARYRLARAAGNLPIHRALWRSLTALLFEWECEVFVGHDLMRVDGRMVCSYCLAPLPRPGRNV